MVGGVMTPPYDKIRKEPSFRLTLLYVGVIDLSWAGQGLSCRRNSPADCCRQNRFGTKAKPTSFRLSVFCVGVTYLPGQARYCPAVATVRWTVAGRKKAPTFRSRLLCWRYRSIPGRPSIVTPSEHAGGMFQASSFFHKRKNIRKEPSFRLTLLYVGVTYLPGQSPAKYCRRL